MVEKKEEKKIMVEEENPSGIAGHVTLNADVVATIARLAARDVPGIHSVGKTPFINLGEDRTRGVAAEVGQKQAAFDLDIVVEYGQDIKEIARHLRERTASEVKKMAGRDVVELNIHVVDIKLPEETQPKRAPRVI